MRYLAILIMLFVSLGSCTTGNESKNSFNIVLITIDSLRADHLSCYGYHRKTSPTIDKIAEQGITYSNAIAPASWTTPSIVSLLTSVYPTNHGVIHGVGYRKDETLYIQEIFSEQLTTIAEALKAQGYTNFAVVSNLSLSEKFGFSRGFDHFECLDYQQARIVNNTLYKWEDTISKSEKFFIWLHYFDPHAPYTPKSPWVNQYTPQSLNQTPGFFKKPFEDINKLIQDLENNGDKLASMIGLYDSEINYVDFFIKPVMNQFNLWEDTLLIITADHGEGFLEHQRSGHGHTLYQELIHIPLIVKLPNSHQKEIDNNYVTLRDIMPTIFDLLGCTPPDHILGKSLLPEKQRFPWLSKLLPWKHETRYILSELQAESLKTIISSGWKYCYSFNDGKECLFNIETDPLESINLIDKEKEQATLLKRKLFNWVDHAKRYPTTKNQHILSKEEQEKLEALGYVAAQEK